MRIPQVGESFGPYQVERVLGRGGMGVVFVATQITLNRAVALKVLLPQFAESEDYRRRFSREASALANAQSPHIVPIFDYGEIEGSLFIATQLVPGSDLGIRISGELELGSIIDITRHITTALADAHAVGVLHRDVKPSNVLIWDRAEGPHAYLCDFGIAKMDDSDHTTTEGTIGTWAFLSPERCNGEPATQESDIYSAGCLLWNMLTGKTPYVGTAVEIAMAHVHNPIPQLPTTSPVTVELNVILRKAMAKDPHDRYRAAGEMARALANLRPKVGPIPALGRPGSDTLDRPQTAILTDQVAEDLVDERGRGRLPLALMALLTAVVMTVLAWTAWPADWPSLSNGSNRSSPPTQSTDEPNPEVAAQCWDGDFVPALRDCSEPTGREGLAWAMPSIDLEDPVCADKANSVPGKQLVFVCPFRFAGATGIIRYSWWNSAKSSRDYYRGDYSGVDPRRISSGRTAPRLVWRLDKRTPQGLYRMTSTYLDWPFSVSVEASTLAAREAGYRQVTFRPEAEMTGIATGSD